MDSQFDTNNTPKAESARAAQAECPSTANQSLELSKSSLPPASNEIDLLNLERQIELIEKLSCATEEHWQQEFTRTQALKELCSVADLDKRAAVSVIRELQRESIGDEGLRVIRATFLSADGSARISARFDEVKDACLEVLKRFQSNPESPPSGKLPKRIELAQDILGVNVPQKWEQELIDTAVQYFINGKVPATYFQVLARVPSKEARAFLEECVLGESLRLVPLNFGTPEKPKIESGSDLKIMLGIAATPWLAPGALFSLNYMGYIGSWGFVAGIASGAICFLWNLACISVVSSSLTELESFNNKPAQLAALEALLLSKDSEETQKFLLHCLNQKNLADDVKVRAAQGLGEMGGTLPSSLLQGILQLLASKDEKALKSALLFAGYIDDYLIRERISDIGSLHPSPEIRNAAFAALKRLRDSRDPLPPSA